MRLLPAASDDVGAAPVGGPAPLVIPHGKLPKYNLSYFSDACINNNLGLVKALWQPSMLDAIRRLGRDDFNMPLLRAAHHLQADVVEFLLEQGLSPRQRGTVHPYTGDQLTVADTQGASRGVDRIMRRLVVPRVCPACTRSVSSFVLFFHSRGREMDNANGE